MANSEDKAKLGEVWDRKIREAQRKERLRRAWVGLAVSLLILIPAVAGFVSSFSKATDDASSLVNAVVQSKIDAALKTQKYEVSNQLAQVSAVISSLRTNDLPGNSSSVELAKLDVRMQAVEKRLGTMEAAVMENPEKSLSIPLMRKDMADSTKRLEDINLSLKSDMDRLYEQQKWMLGGIGAVLLAVAGGSITIILKSLPGGKNAPETE